MEKESVVLGIKDERVFESDEALDLIRRLLPYPSPDANKYSRGKLVVVAGSARYPGAAVLAARAGQRMGAGYTEVVTAPQAATIALNASPSLVVRSLDDWKPTDIPQFTPAKPVAVCLGPGFDSSDDRCNDLVFEVLGAAECPVIVDGGALSALEQIRAERFLERRADAGWPTVITPHGGEAARLGSAWGLDVASFDQEDFAMELADRLCCTVVLKGPDTVVACSDQSFRMGFGGPELAKAGTGDVLAGMVGALLAQGMNAFDAVFLAVGLHALAGAAAAEQLTSISVCAEDVLDSIPDVLRRIS